MLGAIQRESYGYQTFFANRVGEIQKTAPVTDWWWIPGDLNIADIITRGSTTDDLKEGSTWQNGPDFLKLPVDEWPMKSPGEVAAQAKENVDRLQRKSFTAAITRSQRKQYKDKRTPQTVDQDSKDKCPVSKQRRAPAGWVNILVTVERFSSLQRLVDVVAWTWRAATNWMKKEGGVANRLPVLTVVERQDALKYLFLAAQEGATFTDTSLDRLVGQ